jgi:hypothetical protein
LKRLAAVLFCAVVPAVAGAVSISPEGLGQALVYPYYTAQAVNGDAFNTYLSVVNHGADAKALRVRLRESRRGRSVGEFNLLLAPHDTWTGAVVPDAAGGARLISADLSCTGGGVEANSPLLMVLSLGAARDDGSGSEPARVREGFAEVLEMASITDLSLLDALSQGGTGNSRACGDTGLALGSSAAAALRAPSGGLSGTLTLINVASGMNFTVPADALANLASRPFYRLPLDPSADFNAPEIDPVSVVMADGAIYRATWSRAVDAVSAALMRYTASAEYVLDAVTASRTEVVATFPTRHFYLPASGNGSPPFTGKAGWAPDCQGLLGDALYDGFFDRAGSGILDDPRTSDFPEPPPASLWMCASSAVLEVNRNYISAPAAATALLGSTSRGFSNYGVLGRQNGWLVWGPYYDAKLVSLASSTRTDALTGTTTTGTQAYFGFPTVGFSARSFSNGTLSCASGRCMGNYGGAYPLQYTRKITSP